MQELSSEEMRTLIYLVKLRLKYESQRRRNVVIDGKDVQYEKVNQLAALKEKLEIMQLAR